MQSLRQSGLKSRGLARNNMRKERCSESQHTSFPKPLRPIVRIGSVATGERLGPLNIARLRNLLHSLLGLLSAL